MPGSRQQAALSEPLRRVQTQQSDRRTSDVAERLNEIGGETEMVYPAIMPRME